MDKLLSGAEASVAAGPAVAGTATAPVAA